MIGPKDPTRYICIKLKRNIFEKIIHFIMYQIWLNDCDHNWCLKVSRNSKGVIL